MLFHTSARVASIGLLLAITGCGSTGQQLFGDQSLAVNTPLYRANKIFYIGPPIETAAGAVDRRYAPLVELYEQENSELDVQNGDPVTILVNKAYLPPSLADPQSRTLRNRLTFRKSRDIAVLLDFGATAGQDEEVLAVWYQRDVPPDEPLSFENLSVFHQDVWNNDSPPYFRMRIVDVSNERNTRTGELLQQVAKFGGQITQLFGTPAAGAVVGIAGRAAELTLANDANRNLIDYTVQFYSPEHAVQAGGVPLGLFRRGAFITMGRPLDEGVEFWDNDFVYDYKRRRVRFAPTSDQVVDTPYLLATVATTQTSIPTVVTRRSAIITRLLSDPAFVREQLGDLLDDAQNLNTALEVYIQRDQFRRQPSVSGFSDLLTNVAGAAGDLPYSERMYLLATFRQTTGQTLSSVTDYQTWFADCQGHLDLDREGKRFTPKPTAPEKCR